MKTLAACVFVVIYISLLVWTLEHFKRCWRKRVVTLEFLLGCIVLGGVGAVVIAQLVP